MTTQAKRRELQESLRTQGFAWDILDNWQPKSDMWWHKPQLNNMGTVVKERGTYAGKMPGNPDSLDRYSRRGLLPWPISDDCRCKGCRDSRGTTVAPETVEVAVPAVELAEHKIVGDGLCACGYKSEAPKKASRKSATYRHLRIMQP